MSPSEDELDKLILETPASAAPPVGAAPQPPQLAAVDGPLPVAPTPGQPAPAAPTSQLESWLRGGLQGLTSNWGDEAAGRLAQVLPAWTNESVGNTLGRLADRMSGRPERPSDAPPIGSYEQGRDFYRGLNAQARAANPRDYLLGEVTGGVAQAASPLGRATPLGQSGVAAGVASGALAGAGASESDDLLQLAADSGVGGLAGGIASTAGPLLGRAVRAVGEGLVRPTQAARELMARGINKLTLGQLDPRSIWGQIEGSSTSVSGAGPTLGQLRGEAVQQWQERVIREGLPPDGVPATPGTPLKQQLGETYDQFSEAYAPVKAAEVMPAFIEEVPGRFKESGAPLSRVVDLESRLAQTIESPSIIATPNERATVARFVQDQLGKIPQEAYGPGGRVNAGILQDVRKALRDAARDATVSENTDRARLLGAAVDQVTDLLEQQLPPDVAAALRAADRQYAQYKIVEDAMYRAGDRPGGFSPFNLEQAIKATTDKRFARGEGGGELRVLEDSAREVFQDPPVTGARALMAGPVPWFTAPAAVVANMAPPVRNALLGQTAPQRLIRAAADNPAIAEPAGAATAELARAGARAATAASTEDAAPPRSTLAGAIAAGLQRNPALAQRYASMLQRASTAAASGADDDGLALEHFLAAQTDPEYQRAMREAGAQ